jgi:hypothetical protein
MTLQDFLVKAHDRKIDNEHLKIAFKEFLYHNFDYEHLDESNRNFIYDLILKHRAKLFAGEGSSATDIEHEYYNIYEHRESLKLLENDLKNVKEILLSFKS